MRHGWDGEPGRHFLVVRRTGASDPSDSPSVYYHGLRQPRSRLARRRASIPSTGVAAWHGDPRAARRRVPATWAGLKWATDGWDHERTHALRRRPRLRAEVHRRQPPSAPPRARAGPGDRLYDEAMPHAGDYGSSASTAPAPPSCWPTLPRPRPPSTTRRSTTSRSRTRSSPPTRVRAYENAPSSTSGLRFHRIIARHRGTGEIAGLTVATVDSETPCLGQPARHLGRARAPRAPARAAAQGRHDALARRGRAAAGDARHVERGVQRRT